MEENLNRAQTLKQKWKTFLNIIFDPWVVVLLILTCILYFFLSNVNNGNVDNKWIITIISTIISLITGLLGGVIANKWAQLTEMKVLVARGKSAIRGLKLILLNVANIEKRTKEYIWNVDKENKEYKLLTSTYEEVIEKCNIVQEEIISAIENWTDIIPEVSNFKTEIGLVSSLKENQFSLNCEIEKLHIKIKDKQDAESVEKEKLIEKLQEKEKELDKAKNELNEKEKELNKSIFSGITSFPITVGKSSFDTQQNLRFCSKCNSSFFGGSPYYNECSQCRIGRVNFKMD